PPAGVDITEGMKRSIQKLRIAGTWGRTNEVVRAGPADWGVEGEFAELSTTCSALTALSLAEEMRILVPPEVWTTALERLLDWQNDEGKTERLRANCVRGTTRVEWEESAVPRVFGALGVDDTPTAGYTAQGAISVLL